MNGNFFEQRKNFLLLRLIVMWILTIWVFFKKVFLRLFQKEPKMNTLWFDGLSAVCRSVKENAFSWRALDIIYNFDSYKETGFPTFVSKWWNDMLNTQAVRNRLKLTKQLLLEAIQSHHKKHGHQEIKILSIASGSAQGVIETLSYVKKQNPSINIQAIFLDLDPTALIYSRELAQKAGVENFITYVNKSTTDLELATKNFQPDIVEMVGFLEYRPSPKDVNLIRRIHNLMASGGVLIVSQIAPNPEQYFLKVVVNWPMIYRTKEKFANIIEQAGFGVNNYHIFSEPLKIHNIALCYKH